MNKIVSLLLVLCTILPVAVQGQDIPKVMPGKYRGDVDTNNGDHALVLIIEKIEGNRFSGVSQFYKGHRGCRHPFPMSGVIEPDGSVKIDASKDVLAGCERKYELKVVGTELQGVLIGSTGTRGVKFTPQ